jgi:phage tail protein X
VEQTKEAFVTLNIKAAMLICLGFIGGVSWIVNRADLPFEEVPTPLESSARAPGPWTGAREAALELDEFGRPPDWSRRFARVNLIETEQKRNRESAPRLDAATLNTDESRSQSPRLPPVVRTFDEPRTRVAGLADHRFPGEEARGDSAAAADDPSESQPGSTPDVAVTKPEAVSRDATEPVRGPQVTSPYRVVRGDSLVKIARRIWNSGDAKYVQALLKANPRVAKRGGRLLAGEQIVIPDPGAPAAQIPRERTRKAGAPKRKGPVAVRAGKSAPQKEGPQARSPAAPTKSGAGGSKKRNAERSFVLSTGKDIARPSVRR